MWRAQIDQRRAGGFCRWQPIANSRLRTVNDVMTGPGLSRSSEEGEERLGEMKTRIQVMVRVRPPLPAELKIGRFTSCLGLGPSNEAGQTLFLTAEGKVTRYTFHRVFPLQTGQEEVFNDGVGEANVALLMKGYNVTMLAFGQTGSGKTHTLFGGKAEMQGLLPRAACALLDRGASLAMSVLDIHEEVAIDLLSPTLDYVVVRGGVGGILVDGLSERDVGDNEDIIEFMDEALDRRKKEVGGSHLVVRLVVKFGDREAWLYIVEVAGSECLEEVGEAVTSDLFALAAMVESLSSNRGFIPYRNSKLTWLLGDILGGNSLTTVIATVSPSCQFAAQTKAALKFAHSCKRIEHLVVQNTPQSLRRCERRMRPKMSSPMPWASHEVTLTRETLETSLGPVSCYWAGPREGTPVVLLHGCPSSTAEFRHFLPALTFNGFRVIGFDQPGYGSSPGVRACSRSDKVTEEGGPVDVLKTVLRSLQLDQPVLLGYDWGAGVGLAFSVLFPTRVAGLVSILPTYTETPDTMLQHLVVPTLLLWVRQDRHHNWKRIKKLVQKSAEVRVEFVRPPEDGVDFSAGCYEEISDLLVQPILSFLSGEETEPKKTDEDEPVVTTIFDHNLSPEEINQILVADNKEASSVKLFRHLTEKQGLDSFHQISPLDPFHSSVSAVIDALPLLSPDRLKKNPFLLVELGLWTNLPTGVQKMQTSPRYFPGRQVLVTLDSDIEDVEEEEEDAIKVARITEVDRESVRFEVEGERGALAGQLTHNKLAWLNQPHEFYFQDSKKLRLEEGVVCDYEAPLVRAKLVEICLKLGPIASQMDFKRPSECASLQKKAISELHSCLNIISFQAGVDRSRVARSKCVGELAVRGQTNCSGLVGTLLAFLLPLAPILGIDLRYRACLRSDTSGGGGDGERHHCLEVMLRPTGESLVVDPWIAEKFSNKAWLGMDMHTAYGRFLRPSGQLVMKTRPKALIKTDFEGM